MSLPDRDLVAEEREAQRRAAPASARERAPRPPGMDNGTKRLALIAGGIGALLVVTVGGWSLLGHRPTGIPVIEPLPGPIRIKPTDAGGMQVMSAQVAQTNGPQAQALAPGPEAAAPQALQAEVDAARQADKPVAPAASATVPASGKPATALPAGGPQAGAAAKPADDPPGARDAGRAASEAAAAAPSAPAPASAGPVDVAPVDAAPAATGAAGPAAEEAAPDAGVPAAPATPPAAESKASAGRHGVQLAAVDSEAAAHAEWARLSRRAPGLLSKRVPTVVPVSHDGKRFFRLRTAGFASAAEASAFCGKLHADGIACTLADF
jgi:hypothetical protein